MGLINKFKNLFTEEVEEEVKPIKKEVRQVEIAAPKRETRETRTTNTDMIPVSDSNVINKEEKFSFPLYFDDKDFDDLEKPKKNEHVSKKEIKKEAYQGAKAQPKVEVSKFRTSPIISPVYGILDKNYKKEDISNRIEKPTDYPRKPRHMTVDDIRNKAFGTLEDDLADTLFGNNSILFKDKDDESDLVEDITNTVMSEEDLDLDIFKELKYDEEKNESENFDEEQFSDVEDMLEEKEELNDDNEDLDEDTANLAKQLEEQKKKLDEINEYINENSEEIDDLEEDKSEEQDDLTESELLNLVDEMYEKRDEE